MMSTTVAILQPHYLPWLGYFEMMDRVDCFIFLDDVDFIKREWKNRNRIRSHPFADDACWLTVPVPKAAQQKTWLCQVPIDYSHSAEWALSHARRLRQSYQGAPRADQLEPILATLADRHTWLSVLNVGLIRAIVHLLRIETEVLLASSFGCPGRKTEKLIHLCRAVGADRYLANNGSAGYLDVAAMEAAGIAVMFQNYHHPRYAQRYKGQCLPWLSHLSIVDLLANAAYPDALAIIRSGRPAADAGAPFPESP